MLLLAAEKEEKGAGRETEEEGRTTEETVLSPLQAFSYFLTEVSDCLHRQAKMKLPGKRGPLRLPKSVLEDLN